MNARVYLENCGEFCVRSPNPVYPDGTPLGPASGVPLMLPQRFAQFVRGVSLAYACLMASAAIVFMPSHALAQTVLRVDDDAGPGGDGSSWTTAFNDLQLALDVAAASPTETFEIRVAAGTYVPTKRTDESDPRSATFAIQSGVAWMGGYAGLGVADPDLRDPDVYVTRLSGDLNGNDGPDFANNWENVFHVIVGVGTDETAVMDGLTVSGGMADDDTVLPELDHLGGGAVIVGSSPTIRGCRFISNMARYGGGLYIYDGSAPEIVDCYFSDNATVGYLSSYGQGGAIRCNLNSSPLVTGCSFERNAASTGAGIAYQGGCEPQIVECAFTNNLAEVGGAFHCTGPGTSDNYTKFASIVDCLFEDNETTIGSGACDVSALEGTFLRCRFHANKTGTVGGALALIGDSDPNPMPSTYLVQDCVFWENSAVTYGGGIVCGISATVQLVNCAISRNSASQGGGVYCSPTSSISIINCSLDGNTGTGIIIGVAAPTTIKNSILWANEPAQIRKAETTIPPPQALLLYTDIQGGWSGPGGNNMNFDPVFVQPGCGNLRLGYDSPCLDAGDNSAVPADVSVDLDGNRRILNGVVDMGAYEGGHDMLPPVACEGDLDAGEFVRLIPAGGPFNPVEESAITVFNMTELDNVWATVTQIDADVYLGAGGYRELASILDMETSLADGDHFSRVMVSFDLASLGGADSLSVDAVYHDQPANTWRLAAEANLADSPGHRGPIGDRITQVGNGSPYGFTSDVGDYGVFWNPVQQRGFAWANVDHATEFAVGILLPACPADCAAPANEIVDISDLLTVVNGWGTAVPGTPGDVNYDNLVNIDDLLQIVHHWGPCP